MTNSFNTEINDQWFEDMDNEDALQQAPTPETNFDDLPDGKYQVEIDLIEFRKSKTTGSVYLNWQLSVLTGEHAGRKIFRRNMCETPENIGYLKKDLLVCGLEVTKFSQIRDRAHELAGVALEVQQKTTVKENGDKFVNVYIQKRLNVEGGGNASTGAGGSPKAAARTSSALGKF